MKSMQLSWYACVHVWTLALSYMHCLSQRPAQDRQTR